MNREAYLEAQRRYNQSEKGRARGYRYDRSEKRHEAHRRYESKHPERKRRYCQT
jgi:hypothetical protein